MPTPSCSSGTTRTSLDRAGSGAFPVETPVQGKVGQENVSQNQDQHRSAEGRGQPVLIQHQRAKSHRLQTIQRADKICFMEHGCIIEQGSHEDLRAQAGRYAAMYQLHVA